MSANQFTGMGHNPNGPDLPEGFGMRLAQEPDALQNFGSLSVQEQTNVVNYMQAARTGEDSQNRVLNAVEMLKDNRIDQLTNGTFHQNLF